MIKNAYPPFLIDIVMKKYLSYKISTLQTHHVDSTLKRREKDRFHVVSTWNPRGVFVG